MGSLSSPSRALSKGAVVLEMLATLLLSSMLVLVPSGDASTVIADQPTISYEGTGEDFISATAEWWFRGGTTAIILMFTGIDKAQIPGNFVDVEFNLRVTNHVNGDFGLDGLVNVTINPGVAGFEYWINYLLLDNVDPNNHIYNWGTPGGKYDTRARISIDKGYILPDGSITIKLHRRPDIKDGYPVAPECTEQPIDMSTTPPTVPTNCYDYDDAFTVHIEVKAKGSTPPEKFIAKPGQVVIAYPGVQHGPRLEHLRFQVIKSPDARLIAMQTGVVEVSTELIRTGDIEDLDGRGFTITSQPGFHINFIGFNIRPDQSYRGRPEVGPVLSDVMFRLACFYGYNQLSIVNTIYKYTVRAVSSLVPPAQSEWYNGAVTKPVFNVGDKFATTEYPAERSTAGVLRCGGYLYSATKSNWVTPYDLDGDGIPGTNHPDRPLTILDDDDVVPDLHVYTPTYEVAPTEAEHGARFIADLHSVGLTSIIHKPYEFWPYLSEVYEFADFDMFMVFCKLGRYPLQLYDMLHSSQDCVVLPWADGSVGVSHPKIDELTEDLKFGVDHDHKVESCMTIQEMLYDHTHPDWAGDPQAYPYMVLYSKVIFNAFAPHVEGIVDSLGYGSDNKWTHMNHRTPSKEITWCWNEEPERLNPLYARTVYAVDIIEKTLDSLYVVSPYDHSNIPWIAYDWEIVETPGDPVSPMHVTFYLRDDVYWQDGHQFTANNVKFALDFLKDYEIPQYYSTWENIVNVTVVNDYEVTVYSSETSQFLVDYFAGAGRGFVPPQVWDRDWENWPDPDRTALENILGYDPTEPYSVAPGYTAGPWADQVPTNLFGTGPFIFQYYDKIGMYGELWANPNYFIATTEIYDLLVWMLWKCGDVDAYDEPQDDPGWIWFMDKVRFGWAYGSVTGDPDYDHYADLNQDGMVDVEDGELIHRNVGLRREYPIPSGGSISSSSDYMKQQSFSSKSLEAQEFSSSTETTIRVDPPTVIDETLQPPNVFAVNTNVSDVSDLRTWQIKMNWDASILDLNDISPTEWFRQVPDPWYSKPHYDDRSPYNVQEKSPSSSSVFPMFSWMLANNAYTSDNKYAYCSTADAEAIYSNYGFNPAAIPEVTELYVGAEQKVVPERDKVNIQVSNDGGTTWGAIHTLDIKETDTLFWWNVTDDFAWTPDMLSNANFKVKITYVQVGPTANTTYADYLVVEELFWDQSKTPTTWTGGWTDPKNVTVSDDNYATCETPDAEETYGNFGFNTAAMTNVTSLWVGLELKTTQWGPIALELQVSNDGGGSWGPNHAVPVFESEILVWVDVTDDFAWTPDMLSDANFKVKVKYKQRGYTLDTLRLDWLPAKVLDTLGVINPHSAYDTVLESYASFNYSQKDGYYKVYDFGHEFPSWVMQGFDERSNIAQVDLYIRYSTGASGAGDKYRITYYTPYFYPNPPFTLVDWTSSATPLDTYNWTDIQDYDPFFPTWDWVDLEDFEIKVEVDKVGPGDPDTFFHLHEVWLSVTYERPASFIARINQDKGWCLFSEITQGRYRGVTGSGSLATLEFQVQEYGKSVLNITNQHPPTKLIRWKGHRVPHTTENGYFSNKILGDVDGDRDVDTSDLLDLSKAYGSKPGDDKWISDCDFNRDDKVDASDLFDLCKNYGKNL